MYLKNELSLFKINLKSFLVNQRIGRIPYVFGCLFISIQKIIMYIIIIGLFSNHLEYQHISLIISQIIALIAYIILIIFRLHDIGKSIVNILYIVGVYIIIHLLWGMELSFSSITNSFLYSAFYPIDSIIIYILPILFLGIYPSIETTNKFGLANGDDIIGYITRGRGVSIHRCDCTSMGHSPEDLERMIEVSWDGSSGESFHVGIDIQAYDRAGILMEVMAVLSELKITITNINAKVQEDTKNVSINLVVDIRDISQLDFVMTKLRRIREVYTVQRSKGGA